MKNDNSDFLRLPPPRGKNVQMRRIREMEIAAALAKEEEYEKGEDYYAFMSNPDEEISYEYGYRFLEALDELERPSHWGVAV